MAFNIQQIYRSLSAFSQDLERVKHLEQQAMQTRQTLIQGLENTQLKSQLKASHPLQQINISLEKQLQHIMQKSTGSWEAGQAQRELSDRYQDRTLLLVCGKVNAGKSSLINFLADQFKGEAIRHFRLLGGEVQPLDNNFEEGCVETTNAIQWVEIGDRLVLMDSPGMHSVTPENEALARRFLDTADGILWLSNSTSPGQVAELEVLRTELETNKPLLPVITQSDINVEDEDEDENIISVLQPKADQDRQDQEQDVHARAADYLEQVNSASKLRMPISVSVHYYCQHTGQQDDDTVVAASGMGRLSEDLVWLIEQARTYKPSKARQQMANYLRRELLNPISQQLRQDFASLHHTLEQEQRKLNNAKRDVTSHVTDHIDKILPDLVEQHRQQRDTQGLQKALGEVINEQLTQETTRYLERSLKNVDRTMNDIAPPELEDFEAITGYVAEKSGSAGAAGATAAGGAIGGVIGSLGGPIGIFAGSTIGAGLGGWLGHNLVEERWVETDTGEVDGSRVLHSATAAIKRLIPRQVDIIMEQMITSMGDSTRYITSLQLVLANFEHDMHELLGADRATVPTP